jgi:hypothetical protein
MKHYGLLFLGVVFVCVCFAGCGIRKVSPEESSFLYAIASDIEALRESFRELADFRTESALRGGGDHFSGLYEKNPRTPVIMNPGNYWFKVSLSRDAVDAFDSPMPVLTVEIPSFKKFLKLRVRGANDALTYALLEIVRKQAKEFGGIREQIDLRNAREGVVAGPSRRRGTMRQF